MFQKFPHLCASCASEMIKVQQEVAMLATNYISLSRADVGFL